MQLLKIVTVRKVELLAAIVGLAVFANGQSGQIHAIYDSPQGYLAGVTRDSSGNLYAGNFQGGAYYGGSIIELSLGTDGQWDATTLYSFSGSPDGAQVFGNLVFDAEGNVYGTTMYGGTGSCKDAYNDVGCGTVFELSPSGTGQWTETVLYSFQDDGDGRYPYAGVALDPSGNVYGTTMNGGAKANLTCFYGCGTVYKLSPAGNGQWTENVLHAFGLSVTDGQSPLSSLVLDANGSIYGTTEYGGVYPCAYGDVQVGCGTIFRLTPTSNGPWDESVFSFNYADGAGPIAGLTFDSAGNLYGTASYGGNNAECPGCGLIFKLIPGTGEHWAISTIHEFTGYNGPDGAVPYGGITIDASGNLYGTTEFGGSRQAGTLFKMLPRGNGGWEKATLSMNGVWTGYFVRSAPVVDPSTGIIYGSTYAGGTGARGVIYKVAP
ncbi:MAG: choice-of-anchor tandem repeat GloVer-containing protein [Terriglobales bacterium]|jgi:uncharacterized repeat protein (TIGR03803 family)